MKRIMIMILFSVRMRIANIMKKTHLETIGISESIMKTEKVR